jgi:hypothetical protein
MIRLRPIGGKWVALPRNQQLTGLAAQVTLGDLRPEQLPDGLSRAGVHDVRQEFFLEFADPRGDRLGGSATHLSRKRGKRNIPVSAACRIEIGGTSPALSE